MWSNTQRVSARKLTVRLKEIHLECGLTVDDITNKLGRTMCVIRMAMEGVPLEVGMRITGISLKVHILDTIDRRSHKSV